MTIRALLSALLHRWYVPVAILLLAGLLMAALLRDGGTYTSRTVVSFTYPDKTSLSYGSGTNDTSVIAFAGAVASEINSGRPIERYSDDSAPYYGAGVREGVLVGLTASGNQWATSYPRADIEIQIVGRSREWVESKQKDLVAEVLATADAQQAGVANTSTAHISAAVVPLTLSIEYVAAGTTGLAAAGLSMLLAALIVGGWLATVVDRAILGWRMRRRERRPAFSYPKERTP